MMYSDSPDHPWIFIHIPRTSGVSLCVTMKSQPGVTVLSGSLRHLTARCCPKHLPAGLFDRAWKFSITRNPWDVVASDYRLTRFHADLITAQTDSTDLWIDRLRRMQRDSRFERFVLEEYCGEFSGIEPGGLWTTWCCAADGTEMGVTPLRYEHLSNKLTWSQLMRRIGISENILRQHANGVPAVSIPWTPDLIRRIGDLCHNDIDKFGYIFPTVHH